MSDWRPVEGLDALADAFTQQEIDERRAAETARLAEARARRDRKRQRAETRSARRCRSAPE